MQKTKLSRHNTLLCGLSIVGSALVAAMPANALGEPQYRVDFSAPKELPNCNDPNGFRALLELAQPRELFDQPATRSLNVRIQAPNTREIVVETTIEELDGQVRSSHQQTYPRSMECYKILHLVAVAAAIDLDRDAPPAPSTPPKRPVPPACPPCELPPPPAPEPKKALRNWFVGTGGRIDFGLAPEQLAGVHLLGGWRWSPSWSIEGHLGATLPKDTRPIKTTVVRVRSIGSFEFVPCYRIAPFGLCGEFVLGTMWFTPLSLKYPRIDSALFAGAGVRGFVEQHLGDRWSVRMDVELFVPLIRASIEDRPRREHWETSVISGSANASLFVWF